MGHVYLGNSSGGIDISKLSTETVVGTSGINSSTAQIVFPTMRKVHIIVSFGAQVSYATAYTLNSFIDITLDGTNWIQIANLSKTPTVYQMAVVINPITRPLISNEIRGIRVRTTGVAIEEVASFTYFYE